MFGLTLNHWKVMSGAPSALQMRVAVVPLSAAALLRAGERSISGESVNKHILQVQQGTEQQDIQGAGWPVIQQDIGGWLFSLTWFNMV